MPPSEPRPQRADPVTQMAALMLAQGWDRGRMTAALRVAWDTDERRIDRLVRDAMAAWEQPYPPDERWLAGILLDLTGVAWAAPGDRPALVPDLPHILAPPPDSGPIPAFTGLPLPRIATEPELAEWLGVSMAHLGWYADCDGRLARRGPDHLRHYRETWLRKRSGGRRLVEAPLPRLKAIQRRILRGILDLVPVHPAAQGFVRGRDCRGHAALHAAEDVVLTLDLKDFFPSVQAGRVHAMFRCLGYPSPVSRLLTGLVTTRTPPDVQASLPARDRHVWRAPHLPQGAPTSPVLANLSAFSLDCRLAGLAGTLGANYSRYADDLAFSGDRGLVFDTGVPVVELIHEIVADCGFRVHPGKTRIMRRGRRQKITGIVVNRHLNVTRQEFDTLKAILTNCLRHGPASQNRDGHRDFRAHLTGRVGWVASLNPRRGEKLYALLDGIDWAA